MRQCQQGTVDREKRKKKKKKTILSCNNFVTVHHTPFERWKYTIGNSRFRTLMKELVGAMIDIVMKCEKAQGKKLDVDERGITRQMPFFRGLVLSPRRYAWPISNGINSPRV